MAIDFEKEIGKTYGRLTLLSFLYRNKLGKPIFKCRCSCGNIVNKDLYALRSGNTSSCGCYRSEYVSNKNMKHGLRHHPLYVVWCSMKDRCYNVNCDAYKYYGGAGIKLSDEWVNSFETFYNDMNISYLEHIEKFGKKETTLDRINPCEGYSKENCRWATWKEQNDSSHKRKFRGK